MSFKVHMLDANLDQFMENMGAYSRNLANVSFRVGFISFERRYPGQYKRMMGDYIWRLIHESD